MTKWISQRLLCPRMGKRAKVFSNVMNLPISLTGMLTHGHKTRGYGHFSLSFLEMGSNFTVTSMAKCLRSLEEPVVDQHGDFLYKSGTSQHPLHDALLQSTSYENCVNYKQDRLQDYTNLCMPKKKLPPILLLQMDNCLGDNKNRFVFAFLSLLTARRVFEIVEVGILPVGHTHEDIDGTYGRLSTKLMRKDIFSFLEIMDTYRTCENHNLYVPYVIDDFFDFKNFVKPHLLDGNAKLIGIKKKASFLDFSS